MKYQISWATRVAILSWAATCLTLPLGATNAFADEAYWIWSSQHDGDQVPHGACYFRRRIDLSRPDQGQITIVADDAYDLYVNGRRIGHGESTDQLIEYDISRYLVRGKNVVGVKVRNTRGSTAALAARVAIRESGGEWETYSTDSSWVTSLSPFLFWNSTLYNDNRWNDAQEFGELGKTAPWDARENIPEEEESALAVGSRHFKVDKEFEVEQVLDHEQTGSLIAMAFNEFGHILASRDGGPLLLIYDSDDDGRVDTVREYCDKIKSCQGILPLNGKVFVTADGPDGNALYVLSDDDRDGKLETVKAIVKFENSGEHSAHGLVLGSDGMIYIVVGNAAVPKIGVNEKSPYRGYYEGDLVPRYEDPGGHALNVKAPGGMVIRTDTSGKNIEIVAGGLRNAYDLAFNREGELMVHDSDMESDMGTAWYRPTRLYHVTPGAEFGWRSGWSKWPDYFVDSLPGILDTGRGSPTGATCYDHFAFPTRYQGAMFYGDWSEGRILAVTMKRNGASYSASSEVFLEGHPLNITDLAVGPGGALYFSTGGRGSNGGIYRVKWKGDVPESVTNLGEGISQAIRQPQLDSAWARQKIAAVRTSLGDAWRGQLRGVARSTANPWYYRTRALTLMQLFGPPPDASLLDSLSRDENEIVRGKAVELMGLFPTEETHVRLIKLLDDPDRLVRRRACEALVRAGQDASLENIADLLAADDRYEAWAARRLLERLPVEKWREEVLASNDHRLFIQGSLALMISHPNKEHASAVIDRFNGLVNEFVTDRNFVDMLRLVQVTLHLGELEPEDVTQLRDILGDEFPSGNDKMNRELIRILTFTQAVKPMDRYLEYLASNKANVDRLHVAMHLRFIKQGWPEGRRLDLIEFFEKASKWEGGSSYKSYLANFERDFAKLLSSDEARSILTRGNEYPNAALGALYAISGNTDDNWVPLLKTLDEQLDGNKQEAAMQVRTGILAVMAQTGTEESKAFLRQVWENEPNRRLVATLGLAQDPDTNWEYLVRAVETMEGDAAREVLAKLAEVDAAPQEPEYFRQVILQGLRLKENGAVQANLLLRHWSGQKFADQNASWNDELKQWQDWFEEEHPDNPPAVLPIANADSKWSMHDLLHHLTSTEGGHGSVTKGAIVFEKAQCIKCHRSGSRGESLGPDLTTVGRRFMKKQVLESILYPSHVISDQYASKTVLTNSGRTYSGIVAGGGQNDVIVLQATGEKVRIEKDEIDEIVPNRKSSMPEGLLDTLTLEEISDLFAYLGMIPVQNVARREDGTTVQ
jgi:putative heme-binding domain-containing protein